MKDYPIGTKYRTSGKHPLECTIIDVHHTYSKLTGELVKTRYVASHKFGPQDVVDYDVVAVTVARGVIV